MVEEDDFNSVFSALSHPLRRNVLVFIVDHGPQGYSELLTKFSLETGTLNYHLERMTTFLEQDEGGKYKATNIGYAAYKLLGAAKTELANPHAPPVSGLGVSQSVRRFGRALFDTLLLPEQAFEDAQTLRWPFLLIGLLAVFGYLLFRWLFTGCTVSLRLSPLTLTMISCEYFLSGVIAYILLTGSFMLASVSIYRRKFSFYSSLACYGVGFLPLILVGMLNFVSDPTYAALRAFVQFLLLAWAAYLFLLAARETFKLTMSQSFTATVMGFILFLVFVRLIIGFSIYPPLNIL